MLLAAAASRDGELLPDGEVVSRIRAGDRLLFEVLMRRYNQRVYRVIRSILRDEAETEDAMQQAWLRAWRLLGQLDDGEAVAGWITRIAANEALGRLRRRAPLDPFPEDDMEAPGTPDPERQAANRELIGILEAAVDRLPPGQRQAFMLRDVEGLDTEVSAAALGVSPDALKVRLHRAHQALRSELGAAVALAPATFRFGAPRCDPMVVWVMARVLLEP